MGKLEQAKGTQELGVVAVLNSMIRLGLIAGVQRMFQEEEAASDKVLRQK